jgi:hypothetical protein
MEHFCEPTTRRYRGNEQDDDDDGIFDEVQLAVPVENFLVYRWDWKDFQAFLIGGVTPKLLWITELAFLVVEDCNYAGVFGHHNYIAATFDATSGKRLVLFLVQTSPSDKTTAEVGVFGVHWRPAIVYN